MKHRLAIVTLILAVGPSYIAASQDGVGGCKALRQAYSAAVGGLTGKTDTQRIEALKNFLAKNPDDPADCVTTDVWQRISTAEKSIITLSAAGDILHPDWVLPCNSFDAKTASCSGPQLDNTSALPEEGLGARLHRTVPRLDVGTIRIDPGYHAKVTAAYGLSDAGLVPLDVSTDAVRLAGLEHRTDHPILIVFLRCPDIPSYRKVVWHLYPRSPAN